MMKPIRFPLYLLALSLSLSGCGESDKQTQKGKRKRPAHLVEVVTVEAKPVAIERIRTGTLKIRRLVRIHSQEEGEIVKLPFFEGDRVKKGDLVAALQDRLLRAELNKADANHRQAKQDLERLTRLADRRLTSDDELAKAKTALDVSKAEQHLLQTRLNYARIKAPFDGIISERLIEPGDVTTKHNHLLTLIDPGSMIVESSVSELLLPHLQKGAAVSIRIDALGVQQFPGKILRIHPKLDPATRQGRVEVNFIQVPSKARAGQLARITFTIPAQNRLLIPFNALQRDRQGEYLYLNDKGKAKLTRVKSGERIGEQVEITTGLNKGDRVVIRGFMGLNNGKKIAVAGEEKKGAKQ